MTVALAEASRLLSPPRRRKRSRRFCSFPLCDRPHRANGWCNAHNEQARRGKELTPLLSLPKYAMTYVAYWQDVFGHLDGVLKIGRAWKWSRIQELQRSGAHVIVAHPGTDASWEREALLEMDRLFPPAFASAADAHDAVVLWRGRGWTECFRVDERDLPMAFRMCIRAFGRGNDEGTNPDDGHRPKLTREQWLRYKQREVARYLAESAAGGDRGGVVDDGGSGGPDPVGCDADRVDGAPAAGLVDGGPRPGGDTPSGARGDRLPTPCTGRSFVVDRDDPARARIACCELVSVRLDALFLHGCRERERGNARASERTGAGVGARARRGPGRSRQMGRTRSHSRCAPQACPPAGTGCSSARLPGSPWRSGREGVRPLRHRRGSTEALPEAGTLRRTDGRVRGAAVQ